MVSRLAAGVFVLAACAQQPKVNSQMKFWPEWNEPKTPLGRFTLPVPGFLQAQRQAGKCSIPLLNAPGVPNERMAMVQPRVVSPKMRVPAPAPPCEDWFKR